MSGKLKKILVLLLSISIFCGVSQMVVSAEQSTNGKLGFTENPNKDAGEVYTNSKTAYKVIVEDDADLLSDSEESMLAEQMIGITDYGNVAFHTTNESGYSAAAYTKEYYRSKFDTRSGTVFLIDMHNREIRIFSDGEIYKTITRNYADTITDNVYTYATDGEYYECASKVFGQINDLLNGRKIAQPMKYVCNAFIAVMGALLINFIVVNKYSKKKKTPEHEILLNTISTFYYTPIEEYFVDKSRKYSPVSSSSSGGSSGGGGGGGGGSSGGGGGHSF